ncbi:MAG: AraC family transcriptional regulator [Eubacteriales bacterium]|nr:AraC family transcriptional regulator [Eubacteriales bacterium]
MEERYISYTDSETYQCLENLQRQPVDLYLKYCGRENCVPSHRFGPNRRKSHVLHLVLAGKGILELDGRRYCLKPGNAFWLQPGVTAWYQADDKDPWTYCWVGFSGLLADESMSSAGFSRKNPVRVIGCRDEVDQIVGQMLAAHKPSWPDFLKRNSLLLLLLSALTEDYRSTIPVKEIETDRARSAAVYVRQAIEYMNNNYGSRLRIGELADYLGVNRCYLSESFKQQVGISPQEYLKKLRMEKAKQLLQRTEFSVSKVASTVGYQDQLAFSKAFRKYSGRSPMKYKEEKKELLVWSKKNESENDDL